MKGWNIFGVWFTFIGSITGAIILNENQTWFHGILFLLNTTGFIFFLRDYFKECQVDGDSVLTQCKENINKEKDN